MGAIEATLRAMGTQKGAIDYLAQDRDDYESLLRIKEWELDTDDQKLVNTAYRRFRIDCFRANSVRKSCAGSEVASSCSIESRIEAKIACKKLRAGLTQGEWLLLMRWFFQEDHRMVPSFYQRVDRIKNKCKEILCH